MVEFAWEYLCAANLTTCRALVRAPFEQDLLPSESVPQCEMDCLHYLKPCGPADSVLGLLYNFMLGHAS
jgi:hypothetical protein